MTVKYQKKTDLYRPFSFPAGFIAGFFHNFPCSIAPLYIGKNIWYNSQQDTRQYQHDPERYEKLHLQSVVISNSIGIFITLLVLFSSHMARRSRDTDSRLLTAILLLLASACVMEMTSFLVDGRKEWICRVLAWLSNSWTYIANPTVALLFLFYTDYYLHKKEKRLSTVYKPHLVMIVLCWIAVIGNLIGGYLFTVDAENVYRRGPGAYLFFIIPFLIVFNALFEVVRYRRLHKNPVFYPIWMFLTPFFIGVLLQMLIYGVSLVWVSTALGVAALYMSMQNELAYRDALTGAYNRHYLAYMLHGWAGNSGIMMDLDLFKEINDRYGHSQGDEALRDMARILMESGPDNSAVIRFAGDEFIMLLPTGDEAAIAETEKKIRAAAEEFNQLNERPYRISLSMGHAVYRQKTADSFLEALDISMYLEKQKRRQARNLTERGQQASREESSLLYSTQYDDLTGLPMLTHFFRQCGEQKARLAAEGKQAALLYMDLDGMKAFNSDHGFAAGDLLLKKYAAILARFYGRESGCHIGGDRFAVFVPADGLEKKLRDFLAEIDRMEIHLPVQVGIYVTGTEDVPVSTAYDRAKIACDTLSSSGKSAYCFYSREMQDELVNRHYIQSSLDRAIEEKWIQVYFQPIIRTMNGRVCAEEALSRWFDPQKGFLSPAEFIPYLEASGQIYKLDLYVVDQVLEKIRLQRDVGLTVVSHSINLSRSDFERCDIVEEIRKRVDAAGEPRANITIEITESTIGSNADFMKKQIERFRELGFPVWMDDFGSGYSSLDVLQSIRFDLIKFDMSFMRKLDEGDEGKIILSELMRMCSALGLDTLCEGVETDEQIRFLNATGCSRLQGFRFCRPIPFSQVLERYENSVQIGFEDPASTEYFDTVGRVNLYDLDVISEGDGNVIRNAFSSLPMGIIEVSGESSRFIRSNASYRDFVKQFLGIDIATESRDFVSFSSTFMKTLVGRCGKQGGRTFYDEKLPDGTIVHSFARWIDTNPVSGEIAIAVAVLSIRQPEAAATRP